MYHRSLNVPRGSWRGGGSAGGGGGGLTDDSGYFGYGALGLSKLNSNSSCSSIVGGASSVGGPRGRRTLSLLESPCPNYSSQSILKAMNRFVRAVENMQATILVPSRLRDMQPESGCGGGGGDEENGVGGGGCIITGGQQTPTRSLHADDLHQFYVMLGEVRDELLWGPGQALLLHGATTTGAGLFHQHPQRSLSQQSDAGGFSLQLGRRQRAVNGGKAASCFSLLSSTGSLPTLSSTPSASLCGSSWSSMQSAARNSSALSGSLTSHSSLTSPLSSSILPPPQHQQQRQPCVRQSLPFTCATVATSVPAASPLTGIAVSGTIGDRRSVGASGNGCSSGSSINNSTSSSSNTSNSSSGSSSSCCSSSSIGGSGSCGAAGCGGGASRRTSRSLQRQMLRAPSVREAGAFASIEATTMTTTSTSSASTTMMTTSTSMTSATTTTDSTTSTPLAAAATVTTSASSLTERNAESAAVAAGGGTSATAVAEYVRSDREPICSSPDASGTATAEAATAAARGDVVASAAAAAAAAVAAVVGSKWRGRGSLASSGASSASASEHEADNDSILADALPVCGLRSCATGEPVRLAELVGKRGANDGGGSGGGTSDGCNCVLVAATADLESPSEEEEQHAPYGGTAGDVASSSGASSSGTGGTSSSGGSYGADCGHGDPLEHGRHLASAFRHHLQGLHVILEHLAESADYLSIRYQREIGLSPAAHYY